MEFNLIDMIMIKAIIGWHFGVIVWKVFKAFKGDR